MIGVDFAKRAIRAAGGAGYMGWSSPSTDYQARIGWTTHGAIQMVPDRGAQRWATYRLIYLSNPWVWSAVNMLAHGLGRMPLNVYQTDKEGFPVRVRSDVVAQGRPSAAQALDTLLTSGFQGQQSGQRMSRKGMITGTLVDRLVYGNAMWLMIRDGVGNVTGLRRIRWRDVLRVEPDQDGWPIAYWWRPWNGYYYGPIQITPAADVIHFGFGSDPEGIYGISPLESCRYTLALHDALVRHLIAFFSNSARPSGFVSLDKDMNKAKAEEIRSLLDGLYASPENAGKVIGIPGGTWQELGKAPDQSAIVELIKLSREETSTAFAVPPPVLGILDNAIKSNVKELREQFGRDSLGPWASDFEEEFAAQLLPQVPGWTNLNVRFNLQSLLLPDFEALAAVADKLGPSWTPDEIRTKLFGLSPLRFKGRSDTPWTAPRTLPMADFPTQLTAETAVKEAGIAQPQPGDAEEETAPDGSEPPARKPIDKAAPNEEN
jgi:HK97 family phage portal protein